jgi:ribulose-5-phosphate 4-epimerase/fuculose-1-phosphate aldolase
VIDGIIKYDFKFTESKPLEKSLWQDIEDVRERIYALGLIGIKDGIGYGNISQKINQNSFVITGTQTGHLNSLDEKHYSLIEEFDDSEFFIKSTGAIKPSSEALTHGTIYNLSADIKAVIHIHSKKLWDFMLDNEYLKTKNVPYGSKQMIHEVKRVYKEINALKNPKLVMAGHEEGVITFGRSLKEAELALYKILQDYL